MQPVVTIAQMREIDGQTIQNNTALSYSYMQKAAVAIVDKILALPVSKKESEVALLCGKGNNGGDGFLVGRMLMEHGFRVTAYGIAPVESLSGVSLLAFEEYVNSGGSFFHVTDSQDLQNLKSFAVIIDALLGTGATGDPRGITADMIHAANNSDALVVSVDTPSGLNSDTGRPMEPTIEADITVSLGYAKLGQLFFPGRYYTGDLKICSLGYPYDVEGAVVDLIQLPSTEDLVTLVPPRNPVGHKYSHGTVFALCGSRGMCGAPTLAATAALTAGCGMYYAFIPESIMIPMSVKLTEPVLVSCAETATGSFAKSARRALHEQHKEADVILMGCGASRDQETAAMMRDVITNNPKPLVIDGDGLTALEGHLELLKKHDHIVLTPHYGEWVRLFGELSTSPLERINALREVATTFGCTILLKGAPTLVATPDGECSILPVGNSGMATAGAGDVLAGIIASFIAQGAPIEEATIAGALIHGMAGDFAANEKSEYALLASDIVTYLSDVFITL